jgi:hypothetical protein
MGGVQYSLVLKLELGYEARYSIALNLFSHKIV